MIPVLSELPIGAQAKIRQALGLLGEALIEIAGTNTDRDAQGELFTAPSTEVAQKPAAASVRRDAIPPAWHKAVAELADTMTARQISEHLGITENRVRYIAKLGGYALRSAKPTPTQPASQAAPEPVEAAPARTHGAVEASESVEDTTPATGPDDASLPSSGPDLPHSPFVLTARRIAVREAADHQAEVDADVEREELIEIQQSEAQSATPPDAATAPGAVAEDGAAAPLHIVTPTAAPSDELNEKPSGTTDSSPREPEAASPPAATEGEVAAEAATSHTEDPKVAASQAKERQRMIAEAKQAVALRKPDPVRPRLREPIKIAMQPVNNDWVRLRHPDGRWLSMDGLSWLDAKASTRENAYLCQRKHLIAAKAKFPLARECNEIAERPWSPRDIEWARGNT